MVNPYLFSPVTSMVSGECAKHLLSQGFTIFGQAVASRPALPKKHRKEVDEIIGICNLGRMNLSENLELSHAIYLANDGKPHRFIQELEARANTQKTMHLLDKTLGEIGMSDRVTELLLTRRSIRTVGELVTMTLRSLMEISGLGPKSSNEIVQKLLAEDLWLRMKFGFTR